MILYLVPILGLAALFVVFGLIPLDWECEGKCGECDHECDLNLPGRRRAP
jgi:hypothetical protein